MPENKKPTRIAIYQQNGNGRAKIAGISRYGHNLEIILIEDITGVLPEFIDDPEDFVSPPPEADLVLSFLKQPDLATWLADHCQEREIPLVAAGSGIENAIAPFTCCGLGRRDDLGSYGDRFGIPEFRVRMEGGKISTVEVDRGASCGATWKAAEAVIGLSKEEALPVIARKAQYFCVANPAAFDPISGKSALHHAGHVHIKALKKAIKSAQEDVNYSS